jgi:FKBP-type peptidyl-prolyl cis-trans isomerase
MKFRTIFSAGMLIILAILSEGSFMHAADKNPREPGAADKDATKEFTTTKSGLKYRILRKSKDTKPGEKDTVKVHYKGWLDGGKVFDSSYGESGEPISFPLNGVIPGWTEGLQFLGKGGMIELEIPHELGYGVDGSGPIPPKATLHFIVELLDVVPAPKPLEPGAVDEDAPEEFTTTKSGLKYRIRRKSDGKKPAAADTVTVHYRGWLDDGEEFDSSYQRGKSISFPLNGVIKGWTEGVQLVGEGGMIELEIPYELGYGAQGSGPIPPKATLHFIVELISIKPAPKAIEPGPVDKDAPEEFTTTKSGLKYRIRRKSDGKKPTAADSVKVHYRGWFDDESVFDSSYQRGKPISFPLNGVIKGWTEGMQLVGEGGMIELEVPYALGYGANGRPGIPPKSTLHFLVELLEVQ